MADLLAPFISKLWTFGVPVLILAGVVGLALGHLRVAGEKWLEGFVRCLVHRPPTKNAENSPLEGATVIDSPHCSTCNKVMVWRVAKRGTTPGQGFWGCSGYPNCRGTRSCGE